MAWVIQNMVCFHTHLRTIHKSYVYIFKGGIGGKGGDVVFVAHEG